MLHQKVQHPRMLIFFFFLRKSFRIYLIYFDKTIFEGVLQK